MVATIETIEQNVSAKATQIARYEKHARFFKDNNMFISNPKSVYKKIGKISVTIKSLPSKEENQEF